MEKHQVCARIVPRITRGEKNTFVSFTDENFVGVSVDPKNAGIISEIKKLGFRKKGEGPLEFWIIDSTSSRHRATVFQALRDLHLPFLRKGKNSPAHIFKDYLRYSLVQGNFDEISWIDDETFEVHSVNENQIQKGKNKNIEIPPSKKVPFGTAGLSKKGWTVIHDDSGKDFLMDPQGKIYPSNK